MSVPDDVEPTDDTHESAGLAEANEVLAVPAPESVEELRMQRDAYRARCSEVEHNYDVLSGYIQDGCYPSGSAESLARTVKRLKGLLDLGTSDREKSLIRQLAITNKKLSEAHREIGRLASSVENRTRDLARLEAAYEMLAEKATMPIPPCPHGRSAASCVWCVANWLGREIAPELSRRRPV